MLAAEGMGREEALDCVGLFGTCCDVDAAEEKGVKSVDISIGNE